jgi:O-antigen ligase
MSADVRRAAATGAASGGAPIGRLIVPALAVAGFVWLRADADFPMVPFLVGAAAGCLVLVPNSPAWVLAPLLITELALFNYSIEPTGLSLRLALVLAGMVLTIGTVVRNGRLADPRFRRVVLPSLAFVLAATLINGLFSGSDYVFKYFRYQASQLMTLVLAACVLRDRRDVRRVVAVALALGLASALAAVWQHYDPESAVYGMADIFWLRGWRGRALGLSDGPVTLANNMTSVLLPLLGFVVAGLLPRGGLRRLVYGALLVLCAGMYVSYTRSALLATGAGLAAMALYLRGSRRLLLLGALVGLVVVYLAALHWGLVGARYSKNANNDRSAASHEALWSVGLAVAMDHPALGIGHEHFEEVSTEYRDVAEDATGERGAIAIGKERPHNDFLSVVISWGSATLACYLLVIVGALRNFAIAARNEDGLVRGLAVGCAGGLATYAADSAFHNYLDSSSALWLYAGLSVALARLPPVGVGARDRPSVARLPGRERTALVRRRVGRLGRRYAMTWG